MLSSKTLDLTVVDFTCADSAIAFADRLCETANAAGIFLREGDPERDAATCKLVRRTAKDWLKAVRKHMEGKNIVEGRYNVNSEAPALDNGKSYSVADALRILPTYDTLHRVAYGTPADPAFLNKYVMAAFESRIRGNKEVDPYLLYRQINAGIARRDPLYLGRPLAWSTSMLDRWYKEMSGGYYVPKLGETEGNTLYDRLQIASILMDTDLWMYEGFNQKAYKQQLFAMMQEEFYATEDQRKRTLKAFRVFLQASRHNVSTMMVSACEQRLRIS